MYIGELIKKYRAENKLSMQDFADRSSLSKAYIGMLEKVINPATGKPISPSLPKMQAIAKAMNLTLDDLLPLLSDDQEVTINTAVPLFSRKGVRIPVLGKVVAGIPIEAITDIEDWEEIPESMAATGEYFALRIKGRSMEPKLLEGDVVIVRRQEVIDSGDTAIVLVNGDEATVKQVKKTDAGITLVGLNVDVYQPHFYTNKDIEALPVQIIGKVIESRHKW